MVMYGYDITVSMTLLAVVLFGSLSRYEKRVGTATP